MIYRVAVAVSILIACASSAVSQAQTWKSGNDGGQPYIEAPSRRAGAHLRLECTQGKTIWMRYYPVRGWDGGAKAAVRIGDYTSSMEIDGGDGALLSNLPGGNIGVEPALIEAMKRAQTLVVEGAAAQRVPVDQRTFSLAGVAGPLNGLQSRCMR